MHKEVTALLNRIAHRLYMDDEKTVTVRTKSDPLEISERESILQA